MNAEANGHNKPVPVTILTGFLGAGKTTLLNKILRADHGLWIGVLVNDFGAINIDSQLVVGVDEGMVSLSNGCICCSIRDDLLAAALQILERPEAPEYLVVEASGVSDPVAVAMTFLTPEMRSLFRLDSIITVVDAEEVRDQRAPSDLILNQIVAAAVVLLNKIDLVAASARPKLHEWVRTIVPRARIVETVHANAPLDLLLGVGRYALRLDSVSGNGQYAYHEHGKHEHAHDHDGCEHDHQHDHSASFKTWSYESDTPLAYEAVKRTFKTLPPSVFRAKGILAIAEEPELRAIIQVVGRRISLTFGEPWGDEQPRNRVVVIGTPDGWDEEELVPHFDANLSQGTLRRKLATAWDWVRNT